MKNNETWEHTEKQIPSSLCSIVYNFPASAEFGRNIPKNKIYGHTTSHKVEKLFVKEIEKIIWSYKLSPTTVNRLPSDDVQEIQILTIALRTGELSLDILQTIDESIPSPILFELRYNGKIRYIASYKRPSESNKEKMLISNYHFQSKWQLDTAPCTELPVTLNMKTLYQSLLISLSPLPLRHSEKPDDLVTRIDNLHVKEREAEGLRNRIKKEKQFNRKVELNRTLHECKIAIEELKK